MCKVNGETASHLLLHNEVATDISNFIFALFGVTWLVPTSITVFVQGRNYCLP